MNRNILVSLIIPIIIICYLLYCYSCPSDIAKTNGFWKASNEFCGESDLDLFLLYINGESSTNKNIKGYILVKNSEGVIMNDPVYIRYKKSQSTSDYTEYDINIKFIDNKEGYDFFPSTQKLQYYKNNGKMVFISDDEITAIVYKDYVMSDIGSVQSDIK